MDYWKGGSLDEVFHPSTTRWFLAVTVAMVGLSLTGCGGSYVPGSVAERYGSPAPNQSIADGEGYLTMSDGVRIYYQTIGRGRDVLVIHGGPGVPSKEPWPVAEALMDDTRYVFFDQRGSGRSDRQIDRLEGVSWRKNAAELERHLGLSRHLVDIETMRRALGNKKIVIVGHSYGGFLAALYAAEYRDHVEDLVLISPANVVVMPNEDGNIYETIRSHLDPVLREEFDIWLEEYFNYRNLWKRDEASNTALNNRFFEFAGETTDNGATWGTEAATDLSLTGGWIQPAIYLSLGRRYDLRDHLSRITAQTTIIVGGAEDLYRGEPNAILSPYLDSIPTSNLVVLDGAGHFPHNAPKQFADVLVEVIDGRL